MISRQRIQDYADRIAAAFHPERIILFGSYAYGTPSEDSDVDLLVVMPTEPRSLKKTVEIRLAVRETFPLDLLVYDPAYLQQRLEWGDCFLQEITQQGQVLYEATHTGVD